MKSQDVPFDERLLIVIGRNFEPPSKADALPRPEI
jgi:hypothetical protein